MDDRKHQRGLDDGEGEAWSNVDSRDLRPLPACADGPRNDRGVGRLLLVLAVTEHMHHRPRMSLVAVSDLAQTPSFEGKPSNENY